MEFFEKMALVREVVGGVSDAALYTRVVILAAFFVVFTLGLSSYLVFQHLSTYYGPSVSSNSSFFFFRFLESGFFLAWRTDCIRGWFELGQVLCEGLRLHFVFVEFEIRLKFEAVEDCKFFLVRRIRENWDTFENIVFCFARIQS